MGRNKNKNRQLKKAAAKRNMRRGKKRLQVETLEPRQLLAGDLVLAAVQSSDGTLLEKGDMRTSDPGELTFIFSSGVNVSASSLDHVEVVRSGGDGDFTNGNEVVIQPGFVGIGDSANELVMRFSESLPDDDFIIRNASTAPDDCRISFEGADLSLNFELDLGARVLAVVPQPVQPQEDGTITQARDQIEVYFNDDELDPTSATTPAFYQLIHTGHRDQFQPDFDTVSSSDDSEPVLPISVEYDAVANKATLTFASDIEDLAPGEGTYRLRIGTNEAQPLAPITIGVPTEPGETIFTASTALGTLSNQPRIITGQIDPVEADDGTIIIRPGGNNDPGHRQVNSLFDRHVTIDADTDPSITTLTYNFRSNYGTTSSGQPLRNQISEVQQERVREVLELYSHYLGVQFIETADQGLTFATGDVRAVLFDATGRDLDFDDDGVADTSTDPDFVPGIAGTGQIQTQFGVEDISLAVLNGANNWSEDFGESYFVEAMRQTGFLLGLGASEDLPLGTIMGGDPGLAFDNIPAPDEIDELFAAPPIDFSDLRDPVFPGSHDIVHGQHIYKPDSNDIDLYRFEIPEDGTFSAETFANREGSSLDTVLRLFRRTPSGAELVSQNDDAFGNDSRLEFDVTQGTYYIGVSAKGNLQYDPTYQSGANGVSSGNYSLRVDFDSTVDNSMVDTTGRRLDGDGDGIEGGVHNFWFRAMDESKTIFVNKDATNGGNGGAEAPFNSIQAAMNAARPGEIVRVVGNHIDDTDATNDKPYEIGFDSFNSPLADGGGDGLLRVKNGVTLMIDAGSVFKLRRGAILAGSESFVTNASGSTIQVLGTPEQSVFFTSFNDTMIGVDNNPLNQPPRRGDWGGIQIRRDIDDVSGNFNYEDQGIFIDTVNYADMRYGGGVLQIASEARVVNPVSLIDARATVTNNTFELNADAAISASPNTFKETNFLSAEFQSDPFTPDYDRIGPDIRGNHLQNNTINGLFVVDRTSGQSTGLEITVSARWDDTDIVHVLANNLTIAGAPGGLLLNGSAVPEGRTTGRLQIDPGTVVKLDGGRIEAGLGATLTVEGDADEPVVFTSIQDDRYGFGGTFDTNNEIDAPEAGDWAGIMALPTSRASFDHTIFAYGGGTGTIEGGFASFNALEIIQADARVTNSTFEFNDRGDISAIEGNRTGRGDNEEGTIFVRGAQPTIVNNVFFSNASAAINVNVDSLNWHGVTDLGRMTGPADVIELYQDNQGPLVRNNVFDSNGNNGMIVRGGTLTTESVWDDTDIVHVVHEGIYVPNFHSFGGLRLRSSQSESLVVKLSGELAGFITTGTANGTPDHIGGSMQILGQPGNPVILTSLWDDTVGAGRDLFGNTQTDTNGGGRPVRTATAGGDNSFQIQLNFGPNIQAVPEAMEAAQLAANIWMEQLQDPVEVSIDVDLADIGGADLADTETFPGAGVLNALNRYNLDEILFETNVEVIEQSYDSVRNNLVRDAGDHEELVKQLPTSSELNIRFPGNVPVDFGVENIELTRANAKAINVGLGSNRVESAYDVDVDAIDGTILISDNPDVFDFDPTDGLKSYREDFQTHFLREIGSVLGFTSGLDNITAQLQTGQVDPNPTTQDVVEVNISPLDLFRFAPGDGSGDFTTAERLLDPQLSEHVFYAGGNHDFREYPYEGITVGDIPLSTGLRRGDELNDVYTAASWHDEEFFRNSRLYQFDTIGVMDPVSIHRDEVIAANDTFVQEHGLVIDITEADRRAFDSIGWDVVGGTPGDWNGIRIEELSYDGNVEFVLESEAPSTAAPGTNALPATAQFLGSLAPNRNAGNEDQRLAFEVHGLINDNNDVDIYSFSGVAGTEVWLDIDQTGSTLDSVIELIGGDGSVIARSNNSPSEAQNDIDLLGTGETFIDPTGDIYTSNLNDAGMRVVLPGPSGLQGTYFVRIRSSSNNLDNVAAGDSNGRYELQVRLRERDEVPGTTVQYANIHFARTGIEIVGPPSDSPLVGEHVEDESINDLYGETIATNLNDEGFVVIDQSYGTADFPFGPNSQDLGNLLSSRQGAVSVFGSLESGAFNVSGFGGDVDWYRFSLGYNDLATQATLTDEVGVVFDIDYADGLGRPDTQIAVYRETATTFTGGGGIIGLGDPRLEMLYYSDNSNLELDQTVAGGPDAIDGGSFGTGDPFIGPVSLTATLPPPSEIIDSAIFDFENVYYVAVTSSNMIPSEIFNSEVELTPVLGNEQRGFEATQVFDPDDPFGLLPRPISTFVPTFGNAISEGEYQLEIRIAPIEEDIQLGSLESDTNRERVQGQIVIANNEILNSRTFGVSIVDNLRDQPTYGGILSENQTIIPNYFNTSTFRQSHGQYTHSDYVPHSGGIPRALPNLNEERVIPGITVSNNVVASGFEGGIQVQGDPGGIVIHTYDLARLCNSFEAFDDGDFDQSRFVVWDHHGNSNMFEFTTDGDTVGDAIPIRVDCAPDLLIIDTGTFQSTENFPTISEFVADEMEHAFRLSDLDVKVFRAEGFAGGAFFETSDGEFEPVEYTTPESFFLEGAVEIGIADVGNGRDPWFLNDITVPIITSQIAPQGAVVSPRIVNNTVVGRGGDLFDGNGTGDVGILIEDNSSPTLVNNIVSNFKTGIEADLSANDSTQERRTFVGNDEPIDQLSLQTETNIDSPLVDVIRFNFAYNLFVDNQLTMRNIDEDDTPYVGPRPTVVGATVYQGNLNDSLRIGTGDFVIDLDNSDPLFVDPLNGNFFLKGSTFDANGNLVELGSRAIDSSINEIAERDYLSETSSSIGIQTTPIRSPDTDSIGILRIDDPFIEPPDGLGSNVFKDRGALERADFVGPSAQVVQPLDNDTAGNDRDATIDSVVVFGELLTSFDIQLLDGASQVDPVGGSGIDDRTLLVEGAIIVRRDGVELTNDVDYRVAYDQTNDTIRIVPLEGVWRTGASYEIQLLNGSEGVLDDADNLIQILDRSGNSLQANRIDGTTRYQISLDSGADFGDAPAPYPSTILDDGARHTLSDGFFLGTGVTVEGDATPNELANSDNGDDGVALPSLLLRGSTTTVTVSASGAGFINGWIDWNRDGVWAGSSEHVLNGIAVNTGSNSLTITVPSGAATGTTYGRFRLSTESALQPTGLAIDGEVEDYSLSVGDTVWRNTANPLDVNNDGAVAPGDALAVINEFNGDTVYSDATGALPDVRPEGAPFLDVNGDGFVAPIDALLVINGLGTSAAPVDNGGSSSTPMAASSEGFVATFDATNLDSSNLEKKKTPTSNILDSIFADEDDSTDLTSPWGQ